MQARIGERQSRTRVREHERGGIQHIKKGEYLVSGETRAATKTNPKSENEKHTSQKPAGSKLTELLTGEKGIGSGPSPPTISLAKPLTLLEVRPTWTGAKAVAVPTRAARARNLVMVDIEKRCLQLGLPNKPMCTVSLREFCTTVKIARILSSTKDPPSRNRKSGIFPT